MKKNLDIKNHLYDGQTIIISGVESSYYPKRLINQIKESGVKDLTLIYIENNIETDPYGDPMQLIYNGQVRKLVTSHLGEMFKNYDEYLDEVELLPMDILVFKTQAAANKLPGKGGIYVDKDYAALYRDESYIERYRFKLPNGNEVVLEEPFNADIAIASVDNLDLETFNCSYGGTAFNCIEVAKSGNMCFVEYLNGVHGMNPDDVDIPGQYIDGAIKSATDTYVKGKWYR